MLRSQIKLTSYDFKDLHITGEFDNRPGTGRFLRIFFCVVTYRTGAGRRLYMKTSADTRPALWEINRTPYGARSILHEFSRAMMNICISKFAIIPPKNQIVKIRKIEADADSDGETTLAQDSKKFNSTCSLHINHPQLLKRNIYICIYAFWS